MNTKREMEVHLSLSGRYKLKIRWSPKHDGYWRWSMGKIVDMEDGEIISIVHRNYPHFWFTWIENHPDGHDYLLVGEDYQGQTIIQLDTRLRRDYLPKSGSGFCWVEVEHEEDSNTILVNGCYWGANFEYVRYDFSSPMDLPYKEMERWDEDYD